jgi:uncharacterized protein (DUF58 family)
VQRVASLCIGVSAVFLIVVAIMLNSPALFYMATSFIALLGACRLQAHWSVKALRFDRIAPGSVRVGEMVTVEIVVWSERQVKRPLVTVRDNFPSRMPVAHLSPSLPIAPAFEQPIRTQYQFRPLRRGRYRWSGVTVYGTDALGQITAHRVYETAPAEIVVLPAPIPASVDLPASLGWGISEAESGQARGAGLEPRGVREYAQGDSLRHVHWRSTARRGTLLVKEFEAGSHSAAAILLQRSKGSDVGKGMFTSLDLMCGHAVFLAEQFQRQGSAIVFPGLEDPRRVKASWERMEEVAHLLAAVEDGSSGSLAKDLLDALETLPHGTAIFLMATVLEPDLAGAVQRAHARGYTVVPLLYDAAEFDPQRATDSAAQPQFIGALRGAGGAPMVMPTGVAG